MEEKILVFNIGDFHASRVALFTSMEFLLSCIKHGIVTVGLEFDSSGSRSSLINRERNFADSMMRIVTLGSAALNEYGLGTGDLGREANFTFLAAQIVLYISKINNYFHNDPFSAFAKLNPHNSNLLYGNREDMMFLALIEKLLISADDTINIFGEFHLFAWYDQLANPDYVKTVDLSCFFSSGSPLYDLAHSVGEKGLREVIRKLLDRVLMYNVSATGGVMVSSEANPGRKELTILGPGSTLNDAEKAVSACNLPRGNKAITFVPGFGVSTAKEAIELAWAVFRRWFGLPEGPGSNRRVYPGSGFIELGAHPATTASPENTMVKRVHGSRVKSYMPVIGYPLGPPPSWKSQGRF